MTDLEIQRLGGATVSINKTDNTFTVIIGNDFYKWASDPRTNNGYSTMGQANLYWLKEELNKFINSQWD